MVPRLGTSDNPGYMIQPKHPSNEERSTAKDFCSTSSEKDEQPTVSTRGKNLVAIYILFGAFFRTLAGENCQVLT